MWFLHRPQVKQSCPRGPHGRSNGVGFVVTAGRRCREVAGECPCHILLGSNQKQIIAVKDFPSGQKMSHHADSSLAYFSILCILVSYCALQSGLTLGCTLSFLSCSWVRLEVRTVSNYLNLFELYGVILVSRYGYLCNMYNHSIHMYVCVVPYHIACYLWSLL